MTERYARLIIGASRGIGQALLRDLQTPGPTLGLARSLPPEGRSESLQVGDANDKESLERCWQWMCATELPRHVILTAATLGPIGSVMHVPTVHFLDGVMDNLRAAYAVLSFFVPRMTSDDRITLFLGGGIGGPRSQSRVLAYTASKASIAMLVESVATDIDTRCSIVGLSPGQFATTFTSSVMDVGPEIAGDELFHSAPQTVERDLDVRNVVRALQAIEAVPALSGRCLAAGRDDLVEIEQTANGPNAFRMRRVDGRFIAQVGS